METEIETKIKNGWISRDIGGRTSFSGNEPIQANEKDWMVNAEYAINNTYAEFFGLDKICRPGEALKFIDGEIVGRKYLPGSVQEGGEIPRILEIKSTIRSIPDVVKLNGIEYTKRYS
jgi:hypothetical protein